MSEITDKLNRAIYYYSVGPNHNIHLSNTEKINMLELVSNSLKEIERLRDEVAGLKAEIDDYKAYNAARTNVIIELNLKYSEQRESIQELAEALIDLYSIWCTAEYALEEGDYDKAETLKDLAEKYLK